MDIQKAKRAAIERIKRRIRKRVRGDAQRPRLSVYRSERHIYAQIIDDYSGRTLCSASSLCAEIRARCAELKPLEAARVVGELVAERAAKAGITAVVFDRNGRRYGGRIAALADAARSKGLQF
ncbi:MAG: 50S ribosomal protein L18 [Planctomycetota bacterium]|nr:50S ribosomal protein L18 [Planctomycetota bacterium]MCX8040823.1 50S ribosomal protein L18 [Planctomycetota bacterium]MDW8372274.1 50S ribosomal protein L18 [Planctomycetota bacterium]